jgi:hypothetical protein
MSDDPTTEADDELASAYLDGEATRDEVAAVEASPSLRARVEELRAVAGAVATTPVDPAPEDARETSIAAALAAAGRFEITDLAAERARRRLRVLSIAAAVLVAIAIGAGLLTQVGGDDSTSTAAKTSASSSSTAEPGGAAGAGAATADQAAAPEVSAFASTAMALGAFDDTADLVNAARGRLAATKSTGGGAPAAGGVQDSAAAGDAAPTATPPCPRPADVVFDGTALLRGAPVTVLIVGEPDHQVIELLDATCAVVFSQPL